MKQRECHLDRIRVSLYMNPTFFVVLLNCIVACYSFLAKNDFSFSFFIKCETSILFSSICSDCKLLLVLLVVCACVSFVNNLICIRVLVEFIFYDTAIFAIIERKKVKIDKL